MAFSLKKESLVKQAQKELAASAISILRKKELTWRLENIIKSTTKEQKGIRKAQGDAAVKFIESQVVTALNPEKTQTSIILKLPTNFDFSAAVLTETLKHVASNHSQKSVYLIGLDHSANRVAHGCFVSLNGLMASRWAAEVAKAVGGGSGGGKGTTTTCIRSGTDMTKLDQGLDAARSYLERLQP
ncbi:alanyl-tRNA synthetase, class IIc [Cladorrhinum sp. PSN332]|nr:alanyl-tRNA synthetase, class IIc [Cladorrhinum sp. PSN332]